jgi:tetratricopeptide (TPR) repeat protein
MVQQAASYIKTALNTGSLNPKKRAALLLALAKMQQKEGKLDEAEQILEEGLGLVTDDVHLLIEKASLFSLKGLFQEAEAFYLSAIEKARQQNDASALSTIYNGLGVLQIYHFSNPEKAKEYYLQSLETARKINHQVRVCTALQNLGLIELQLNQDFAQAKTYILEALTIARELGHEERISAVLQSRGALEASQQNYAQAAIYFEEALQKARISNNIEAITYALAQLADVSIALEEIARAETYLEEMSTYALTLENPMFINFICDKLIEAGELRLARKEIDLRETVWIKILDAARESDIDSDKLAKMQDTLSSIQSFTSSN